MKKEPPHINVDFFEDLTGDISKSAQPSVEEIGNRIRKLREDKGLSLDELSKMTGFEIELLSQIESNEVQPQLGTIIKLSKALDSAFSRLISGVGEKIYSITRKADQKIISRSSTLTGKKKLYTYKSLAPEVKGRHMEALIVQLEENPEDEISVHEGEEFIYVLNGVVKLKIGEDAFELEPGDSAYYLSTTPHILGSKKGSATILAVLYGG
ncbi:MAG: XRE family transcriptional regulator [Desulfobacteraceae bacterium IS3]|nr:MAG: XRE family transcriptional regulator [Desulfobacteraceae bacterium IS3]